MQRDKVSLVRNRESLWEPYCFSRIADKIGKLKSYTHLQKREWVSIVIYLGFDKYFQKYFDKNVLYESKSSLTWNIYFETLLTCAKH